MSKLAAPVAALAFAACTPRSPAPAPAPAPRPVTLTYLGVAGWQIEGDGHVILVDPYLSRISADVPDAEPIHPDEAAVAAHAPARADLILIGHSHFDHLLDAPAIARRTGAQILGTESTARVARAAGVADDHIIPVVGGEDYAFDGFSVRVIPSLHSALGDKHILGATSVIPADVTLPMPRSGYQEGGTLAYLLRLGGREILILGTANFIERELEGIHPDVAIVAVGLREEIHDYSCRLMRVLGQPGLVLANHFDAWTRPLGPDQMALEPGARESLDRFGDEIRTCAPRARVVIPEHLRPIRF